MYQSVFAPGLITGQVVMVSGGGSGIGCCRAHELARVGAQALGLATDVCSNDSAVQAIVQAHVRSSDIDVLARGAAGNFLAEVSGLPSNGFKVLVEIDLSDTFHVMRCAYHHLRKPGVDQLKRVQAQERGRVRVNAISFGPVETAPKACATFRRKAPKTRAKWATLCRCGAWERRRLLPTSPCSWARA